MLLKPKTVKVGEKEYIISKFPATRGREIISQYVSSALPKIGDYSKNEELMLKLMGYVGIILKGDTVPTILSNRALVDNHVDSWEDLVKLEALMMEYNCGFFQNGRASTFLAGIAQKAPAWVTKMLTRLLQQLSQTVKQVSES